MRLTDYLFLFLLCLSLILLIAVLGYYWSFRKYTRERFAFRVFLLISSLSGSLILIILSGNTALGLSAALIADFLGLDSTQYEPSFSDKALAVVLILGLIVLP